MNRYRSMRRRARGIFYSRFMVLLTHPLFWLLTVVGNLMIFLGGLALYFFESKSDQQNMFIDFLLWSTSLVTTVGYKTYVPETFMGKVIVMILMLLGTFFLWAYMAFLVTALISPTLNSIEKEVQEVEDELTQLKSNEFAKSKKES